MKTKINLNLLLCIILLTCNSIMSIDPETFLRGTYGEFDVEGYSQKTFNFTEYDWFKEHNDTNITHSKCRYVHNSLNSTKTDEDWNKPLGIPILFKDVYACVINVTDQNENTIYLADYDIGTFEYTYNQWYENKRLLTLNDHNEPLLNGSFYDIMVLNNHLFIAFKDIIPDIPHTHCLISALVYFYDKPITMNSDLHDYVDIEVLKAINDTIGTNYAYQYLDMNSISYIKPYALNETINNYAYLLKDVEIISNDLYATYAELINTLTCESEKCYITKQNYESLSHSSKARLLYSEDSYACFAFNRNDKDVIKIICIKFSNTAQLFHNTVAFEFDFERNRTNLEYLKIYGDSFIFNQEDHYFYLDLKYKDNTTEILECNLETNNCKSVNQYLNYNLHAKRYMNNPSYAVSIATSTNEIIKLSEDILYTKVIEDGNSLYTTDQYFNCFRYEYQSQITHNWISSDLISYCNGVDYSITIDTTQVINVTATLDILDVFDNYAQINIKNTGKRYIAKIIVDLTFYDGSKQILYRHLNDFTTTTKHDHDLSVIDLFVDINMTKLNVPILVALYDQYHGLIYYDVLRLDFLYGDTFITLSSNGELLSEFTINGDKYYGVYAVPENTTEIFISVANRIKPTVYKINPYQTGYIEIPMESYHWLSRAWYPYPWQNSAVLSIYENDSIEYFKLVYASPLKKPVVLVPSLAKLSLLIDFLSGDDADMLGFERTETDPLFQFVFNYDKYMTISDKYLKICIKFTGDNNLYCSTTYKNNKYYFMGKGFIILFLIMLIILALIGIYISKLK